MQKLFPLLLSLAAACTASSAAHADYLWVSAGEYGTKPDRVQVLVDLGNVKLDEDGPFGARKAFIQLPAYVIYESKDKPDFSSLTIRNFCGETPASAIAEPFTYWRNNQKSNEASAVAFAFPAELTATLETLICGDAAAVLASGKIKEIAESHAKEPYPIDYPWKATWLDGKRPPYTNTPSRAEQDAEFNAKMAEAKALLGGAAAMAEAQIAKGDAEKAFWEDQAQRRKNRPKSKLNRFVEGWLRKDEEYLIQTIGMPDKSYQAGNTRILFYDSRGNWSQVFTTVDPGGNVVGVARQDYYCSLTLELQNNQLIDFKVVGNSCEYGEFGQR